MRPGRLLHLAKRWLYLIHRWIGIATCLLFLMWFVSGLVMVYVPFPSLTRTEWLQGADPIDWARVTLEPANALRAAHADTTAQLDLAMRDGEPVWRIVTAERRRIIVSAVDGRRLDGISAAQAARIAARFDHDPRLPPIQRLQRDQWTVAGGYDKDRPLYRADMRSAGGRALYVSSRSGAVVLDTNKRERFWNWLGSVPHWLYPTALRRNQPAWRQVVLWTSGPCILVAVSGIWIGILRLRLRRRYSRDRITPYRGWMRWHHFAGLLGSVSLLSWIVSGWLSVDPRRWFASSGIGQAALADYGRAAALPAMDLSRLGTQRQFADTRRMSVNWSDGEAFLTLEGPVQENILAAKTLQPEQLSLERLIRTGRRLVPGATFVSSEMLTSEDNYYYSQDGSRELPILRMRFSDPARTWIYLNPRSGALVLSLDKTRRAYRWSFDAAHKLDFRGLYQRRPNWDILVWLLSLLGLVISGTGVIVGCRRLQGHLRRSKRDTGVPSDQRGRREQQRLDALDEPQIESQAI